MIARHYVDSRRVHKGRRGINCGPDFKVRSDDMEPAGNKRLPWAGL